MSIQTKVICDRCGKEIVYRGWTAKLKLFRKRPVMLRVLKLNNGNPSGYDYFEREYELCPICSLALNGFLEGATDEGKAD